MQPRHTWYKSVFGFYPMHEEVETGQRSLLPLVPNVACSNPAIESRFKPITNLNPYLYCSELIPNLTILELIPKCNLKHFNIWRLEQLRIWTFNSDVRLWASCMRELWEGNQQQHQTQRHSVWIIHDGRRTFHPEHTVTTCRCAWLQTDYCRPLHTYITGSHNRRVPYILWQSGQTDFYIILMCSCRHCSLCILSAYNPVYTLLQSWNLQ